MSSLTDYDPSLRKNAVSSPPKLLPFDEIQTILAKLLSTKEGVDAIMASQMEAFRLASASPSKCASLPIQTAGQMPYPPLSAGPGAQMCIKSGYAVDDSVVVSKCAAGGGNYSGNTGSVSVYDQQTLRLKAVLCDEGLLTEIRTAAAAVCATRAAILASGKTVQKVGIIGGGVQAIWNLRLLAASKTIDPAQVTIVVKTSSKQSALSFIEKMKNSTYELDRQFTNMEVYDETASRFKGCQIIHTLTPARSPVLDLSDVDIPKDGTNSFLHISAIGSDSPGKCELSIDLLKQAYICLVDSSSQTAERGEFQPVRWEDRSNVNFELIEIGSKGLICEESGMLKVKREEAGSHRNLFSVFDSSGMAIQDVQMAKMISQH